MAKKREEPQAIEAEQSVLGSMILEREAIARVIEILNDRSFYLDSHRKIFNTILSLYDKNIPVDLVTLTDELNNRKESETIGGAEYLATLLEQTPSITNIIHYAKIVKEKATLREMIIAAQKIASAGYETVSNVDDVLDKAEQLVFNIKEKRVTKGFTPIKAIVKESFEVIEQLRESKKRVTGIPSGFRDLDNLTTGFHPQELIVIAARPSIGKTALCLNIAANAAMRAKSGVGIFSLEMAKQQVVQRMLCTEAEVSSQKVRTGYVGDKDWPNLTAAAGALYEAPIFIDDTPAISILELRAKARRLKSKEDIKLIIVDYLQLMSGPSTENRQQEISAISRSLKGLAKELDIPIIAVSQLSRAVETRQDRRPILSDLRESGAIEQDADSVFFIHRPHRYSEDPDKKGRADIIIGKQRNGPLGTIKLAFLEEYTKFKDLSKERMME